MTEPSPEDSDSTGDSVEMGWDAGFIHFIFKSFTDHFDAQPGLKATELCYVL